MADTTCAIQIHCQPELLWSILWDVERYPEFLTETVDCRVQRSDGTPGRQQQQADFRVQLIRPLQYTADMIGEPPTRIEWQAVGVSGALLRHAGSWTIEPDPDRRTCTLSYELDVAFALPIPDAVIRRFADLNLPTMLRQVKARAELLARRQEMLVG